MIEGYFRPQTIYEALIALEKRRSVRPLAGGTTFSHVTSKISVVDLQNLGLNKITEDVNDYFVGSMVTIESLLEYFKDQIAFVNAIHIQAGKNQREQGTIGGLVCSENGRSALLTLLLALDPIMILEPMTREVLLSQWISRRKELKDGLLITGFRINKGLSVKFESIGRSPLDKPVICIAMSKWKSGRLRIVAGGFGEHPIVLYDGANCNKIESKFFSVFDESGDEWGSADYRKSTAKVIINRMLTDGYIVKEELE